MRLFKTLRNKLIRWAMAKAITEAFTALRGEHLGDKLQAALDAKMGVTSKQFRIELGDWLITLGQEVKT